MYESFLNARRDAVDDTNKYYNGPAKESGGLSVFKSGVEMVNFVYGEVEFFDFYKILMTIFEREYIHLEQKHTFLDLGCGAGIFNFHFFPPVLLLYLLKLKPRRLFSCCSSRSYSG